MRGSPVFVFVAVKRFRVTGCSRVGDVWLHSNVDEDTTYEHRVDVDACSEWSAEPTPPTNGEYPDRPWPPTETEESWLERHKGHTTEPYTPDPSCERAVWFCHDCDEEQSWPNARYLADVGARKLEVTDGQA